MDKIKWFVPSVSIMFSVESLAYIGPGMAGGVVVAIIGLILSFFMLLAGILYFPAKRMLGRRKKEKEDQKDLDRDRGEPNEDVDAV